MTPFFLQLSPQQEQSSITYNSKVFLIGSCFVENIGNKLNYHKFRTTVNPFGIVFHPKAIENLLKRIVKQQLFTESDIFYHNEQWHCFEVHSELSHSDKDYFLEHLNSTLKDGYNQLKEASHIVLTFGTAWGYIHRDTNSTVANCHKIPQQKFNKQLSSIVDLQNSFLNCFKLIEQLNPKAQIITTISPVRHIKDGITENNRSKSHLISALQQIIENRKNTLYYPAYELVIDCLRDYRFYKADLVHPNDLAVDYIWEHFIQTWIHEPQTLQTLKRVLEIQRGLQHKPFNPNSEAHKKFENSLNKKIMELKKRFSFMRFKIAPFLMIII